MKFEEAKVEEWHQAKGLRGIYAAIERTGKICTGLQPSNDRETETKFVQRLVDSDPQHGRPLEFGTVYLTLPWWRVFTALKFLFNKFSKSRKFYYVTTNYRVIVENGWYDALKYLSNDGENTPTENHAVRRTLHWTISRGIADEFRTHVSISSMMQSTRYCNFGKDRFGNGITFIFPQWAYGMIPQNVYKENLHRTGGDGWAELARKYDERFVRYENTLKAEEEFYLWATTNEKEELQLKPQFARGPLGLDLKTEFVQCAFEDDWKHFFYLRVEKGAHPDAVYIAQWAQRVLGIFERKY